MLGVWVFTITGLNNMKWLKDKIRDCLEIPSNESTEDSINDFKRVDLRIEHNILSRLSDIEDTLNSHKKILDDMLKDFNKQVDLRCNKIERAGNILESNAAKLAGRMAANIRKEIENKAINEIGVEEIVREINKYQVISKIT